MTTTPIEKGMPVLRRSDGALGFVQYVHDDGAVLVKWRGEMLPTNYPATRVAESIEWPEPVRE